MQYASVSGSVGLPVISFQVGGSGRLHQQMLHVPPRKQKAAGDKHTAHREEQGFTEASSRTRLWFLLWMWYFLTDNQQPWIHVLDRNYKNKEPAGKTAQFKFLTVMINDPHQVSDLYINYIKHFYMQ